MCSWATLALLESSFGTVFLLSLSLALHLDYPYLPLAPGPHSQTAFFAGVICGLISVMLGFWMCRGGGGGVGGKSETEMLVLLSEVEMT